MTNPKQLKTRDRIIQNKARYMNEHQSYQSDRQSLLTPMWDKRMLTGKKPKPFEPLPNTVSHEACDRAVRGTIIRHALTQLFRHRA